MGLPKQFNPGKMPSELYEGIEYKDFWAGDSRTRLDLLEHSLVRDLLPDSGGRFIDIGCGYGRLADCYLDKFDQVVMLDGSMTLLKQAQESYKEKAFYIAADANHLPFCKSSFDCVLMMRVFHHLPNSPGVLEETKRILGKDGIFIFNYTNKLNLKQLVRRLFRLGKESPFVLEPVLSGKTLINHHPSYIHKLLTKTDFAQIKYFGTGVMDKISGKFGPPGKWLSSDKAIAPMLGILKLAPWIVCKAQATTGDSVAKDKCMDDLLVCPSCHNSVSRTPTSYLCRTCNISYPITDGIADFRPHI